jgi:hypothetical protein
MISTKKIMLTIIFVSIGVFWLAWEKQNFALLLLASALLSSAISYFVRRFRAASIPVAVGLFCLSIAEVALPFITSSVANKPVFYDPESDYANGYSEQIEGFGYRSTPGVHSSRKLTLDGEVIYDVTYTIGDDGYRMSRTSEPFMANVYGGSFTFGEGLNDNETLVHYLWADHGFNAKSVGIHGYGLQQALYNIEHGLTTSEGFNILLTVPWHALRSSCKPFYASGTPRYEVEGEYARLAGVCSDEGLFSRIARHSNIFKLVQKVLYNEKNRITDEDIELYLAIVRTIARHTHESNSRLVIAYIQATQERMQFTEWSNESLVEELKVISDIFVDVTLSDEQETLDPKYYIHELDPHPSAQANRERAQLIFQSLSNSR